MEKISRILLISFFCLTIISCGEKEENDDSGPSNKLLSGTMQGIEPSLTGKVTTIVGPAAGSTDNASTDGTGNDARFNGPYGVTTDGTNLYVSDFKNNKIRKVVISSGEVTTLAGPAAGSTDNASTDGTGNDARFYGSAGITNDGINLYVGDWENNKIRKIVISSGVVTTLAGVAAGSNTSGDTDCTGNDARFDAAAEITSDGTYLYVAEFDNNKIRRIE